MWALRKLYYWEKEEWISSWQLSGFVCDRHPAVHGSYPKHTIYAFIVSFYTIFVIVLQERMKKQNEPGFGLHKRVLLNKNKDKRVDYVRRESGLRRHQRDSNKGLNRKVRLTQEDIDKRKL